VLVVTAFELRHPIALLVLMETDDEPLRDHVYPHPFDSTRASVLELIDCSAASFPFHSASMADSERPPIIESGLEPFRHSFRSASDP
jgi:hypothetical protein